MSQSDLGSKDRVGDRGSAGSAMRPPGAALGTEPTPAENPDAPEAPLWSGRTSWKHYFGRAFLWFLINVGITLLAFWLSGSGGSISGTVAFWASLVVAVVSAGIMLGPVLLAVWGTRYQVTSQRLIIERGILSRTIDQTELVRVDDVRIHKSVIDRVFGLGSVGVISTDVTDRELPIPGIADPERVAEAIRARMKVLRKKSLYVENI